MPSTRRVHIDRHDIHANLHARIQYLHSFLDFNASDIQALTVGTKYIRASIPLVADKVYKKLLQYDITASSFADRDQQNDQVSKDSPQIQYRKLFLQGYLQKICSDPSKFEFWEYMDKVGMMHCNKRRLHVEYVHLGMCIGFIQDILTEEIMMHPRLKLDRKLALMKALNKVLWIQNDLFARWHIRDGEEMKEPMLSPTSERDGLLHGKMMLSLDESSGTEDGLSPAMSYMGTPAEELRSCPFTGLVDRLERAAREGTV